MNEDMPQRKNIRLPGYDYSQNGAYFITICSKGRAPLLGKIVGAAALGGPHTVLSNYGQITEQYISNINTKYQDVSVPVYCIMPNHVHMIILIAAPCIRSPRAATPTVPIPQIINALKSLSTKKAGIPLWQRGYYEHIIRCEQDYLDIWQYIETNPAKWAEDQYYQRDDISYQEERMEKIILSADSYPAIYLVPDFIADELRKYIDLFFDWLYDRKNDHGYWMKFPDGEYGVCYTEEAFIKWLNENIIEGNEKARLIRKKEKLSREEERYPSFNF